MHFHTPSSGPQTVLDCEHYAAQLCDTSVRESFSPATCLLRSVGSLKPPVWDLGRLEASGIPADMRALGG